MKNNTKIRLHLSKQLFEALTKQVLAESKANDGYTVAVKQPKAMKEVNAVDDTDKMRKMNEKMSSKEKMAKGLYKETDKMKKMEEMSSKDEMKKMEEMSSKDEMKKMEEMSSKEKMKKGLYKEDAGKLQPGEKVSWLDGNQKELKGVVQTQEEGDYYTIKVTAAPAGGHKVGAMLTKQSGDLKKDMAEGDLNEISAEMDLLQQAAPILGTILGVGGTFIASYVKAMKSAKTPKEKEELNKALRNQINKSKGF